MYKRQVYAAYAEEDADFDALAKQQERLEAILAAGDAHTLETVSYTHLDVYKRQSRMATPRPNVSASMPFCGIVCGRKPTLTLNAWGQRAAQTLSLIHT